MNINSSLPDPPETPESCPQLDLEAKVNALEATQRWLTALVTNMLGISSVWMTPAQASMILGMNKEMILREVRAAEAHRLDGTFYALRYGVHYRNDQDPSSTIPTWKINLAAYQEFLKVPPTERCTDPTSTD